MRAGEGTNVYGITEYRSKMYRGDTCHVDLVRVNINSSREYWRILNAVSGFMLLTCESVACQQSCTVGMKIARIHVYGAAEFGTSSLN